MTKEEYNRQGKGRFFPAASRRLPTVYQLRTFAFSRSKSPHVPLTSRAVSAQDTPMSSTTISDQDYNVNILASSLLQRQQQYQPLRQSEVRVLWSSPCHNQFELVVSQDDCRWMSSAKKAIFG